MKKLSSNHTQETDNSISNLKGLNLQISKPESVTADPARCILSQKNNTSERRSSGEVVRKRVLRNDIVHKRIKILGPDCEFKYHNTYRCYKQCTDPRNPIPILEEEHEVEDAPPPVNSPSTRSSITPRPKPSSNVKPIYMKCCVCGSVKVNVKGQRLRENFRICCAERALNF